MTVHNEENDQVNDILYPLYSGKQFKTITDCNKRPTI